MKHPARERQPFARISARFYSRFPAESEVVPIAAKGGLTRKIEIVITRASPTTPVAGDAFQGGTVASLSFEKSSKKGVDSGNRPD
ncbi:hypothetical protein [Roseiterribacter gracilis]|uniref:hypothetical protein n=1 Tax=Roseiterribacter gracilis TaxID=2812848 RepID=UPI003B432E2D